MKKILISMIMMNAVACDQRPYTDAESGKAELFSTDRAFSARCAERGMRDAFVANAADDVIKPQEGSQPVVGKQALIKSFEGSAPQDFVLSWEPLKADVSGGLGYTFGNWQRKERTASGSDTTFYGNYITIWKRQPDGAWKFVFDSGNETPGPTRLE